MLQSFSLVKYFKRRLCSFVLYLQLLNAELVFAISVDGFNCVFIDNGQNLQYKKLNWFLECQIFLIFWVTITKISG